MGLQLRSFFHAASGFAVLVTVLVLSVVKPDGKTGSGFWQRAANLRYDMSGAKRL